MFFAGADKSRSLGRHCDLVMTDREDLAESARMVLETIMNHAQEILQSLTERFSATANVKQVFGDPIEARGKTIVPVAWVAYHVGAGWGGRKGESAEGEQRGGGGGGGAVVAAPAGVLEVTDGSTRFVRFFDAKVAAAFVAGGVLLGLLGGRLLSRR